MNGPPPFVSAGPFTFGLGVPQVIDDGSALRELGDLAADAEARYPELACLWTSDRVMGDLPALEPMALLAFLAARTIRVRLGVAVVVLPMRNPVEMARLAATVDRLSDGRLLLGLGAGSAVHLEAAGYPDEGWGDAYEQAVVTTTQLMSGARVSVSTPAGRLDDATVRPCPQQKPLPVWLSGHSAPALSRAARIATGWIGSGSADPLRFEQSVKRLRQDLDACGRPAESFTIAKRIYIHVEGPDSDREIASWSNQLFGGADLGSRIVVSGSPTSCVDQLERLVVSGAQHLILDPVVPGAARVETLVADVVRPLAKRFS